MLAKCLREIPQLGDALDAYERLRRTRAERVVAAARQQGNNKAAPNGLARAFRDLLLPLVLQHLSNSKTLDWLYSYSVPWDAPLELPGVKAPIRN